MKQLKTDKKREHKQTFLQRHSDGQQTSTSLIIKEMKIKTTMKYHLTHVRKAKINNTRNNKGWQGCRERRTILHRWWECKLVQSLWKRAWRFLKKLKIELSYNPVIALLKGFKSTNAKRHMQPDVYSGIIYNSQIMEAAQVSIDWWINKEDVICIYNGILHSHKKNGILSFATTWMEVECIMLSEINLGKANIIWFHSHVEFKKQNRWT